MFAPVTMQTSADVTSNTPSKLEPPKLSGSNKAEGMA